MKNKTLAVSLAALFLYLAGASEGPAAAAAALTLDEAYQLALKRSEDLAMQKELLNAAQGHFYQSFDVILPSLSYELTHFRQGVPDGGSSTGSSDFTSNLRRESRREQRFTLSQPLFSGFKEIAALTGAGAEKKQRRHQLQRAKELLYRDVVNAYYALLQAQKDAAILVQVHDLMEKRREDLLGRTRLGRSRDSEVQSAISDLRINESDLEISKRTEAIAKQLLEFYIGRPVAEPLEDAAQAESAQDLESCLARARERADVKAAENAKILADKKMVSAYAGFYPTVSLDGNYYTERVGSQSDIDWDVLLTVDVPIFDKLNTFGDIKVAEADKNTAALTVEKTKRVAELEIKNAFQDLESSRIIEKKLGEAVEASKKNYDIHVEEYGRNLVNNLDVLDALRNFQEIHRRHNAAHYDMKKSYWGLKVASGSLSGEIEMR